MSPNVRLSRPALTIVSPRQSETNEGLAILEEDIPKPPKGTKAAGRRLWTAVLSEYELEQHEEALLKEAVRAVDRLDALEALLERDGLLLSSPSGDRVHPAAIEARQLAIALARLTAALRLPAGEEDEGERRPQRRVGVRGVYGISA